MKPCFLGFILVVALITSSQTRLIIPKEQKDRLEVHCIEEYGKYCNGKLAGFKFNDGCRICKCDKESVLCKKGPCQFYTKTDQDALDYCDSILLQNKNSYKLYKQQQWRKSISGKAQLKNMRNDGKSGRLPQHPQPQNPIDRSMLGVVGQQGDEKLIRGPNLSHQPKIGISGLSNEALSSNLIGADDYREAFAQPAHLTKQNVGTLNKQKERNHASNSVVPNIQASGLDSGELSPILFQENQPSKQLSGLPSSGKLHLDRNFHSKPPGPNRLRPDLGPLALKPSFPKGTLMGNMPPAVQVNGLPVSGIVQKNGKVLSQSIGPNIQKPGIGLAALSPALPLGSQQFSKLPRIDKSDAFRGLPSSNMIKTNIKTVPGSMSPNIQPSGIGLVPPPQAFPHANPTPQLLQVFERGSPAKGANFPGPIVQQNLLHKDMPPPVIQLGPQLMRPINHGLSNQFSGSNSLPSSGILKSDGSIEQLPVKTPNVSNVKKDASTSVPTSNVENPETGLNSNPQENILPQPLKQDSPDKIFSHSKPKGETVLSQSGQNPITEFEDKNGQKYYNLPSKQFDELKHLAEGSSFGDHTRLDAVFQQQPQQFKERHVHQSNSQPNWRPMDTQNQHPKQPSCNTAPITCDMNYGGMQPLSSLPLLGNSFHPSSSPMYYGPGPYIAPTPWINSWQAPGGFSGNGLMQNGFVPQIIDQHMGPGSSHVAAPNAVNLRETFDAEKNIELKELAKQKEEVMSEKAKHLLELTKSAIRVLLRAKQNESVTDTPSTAINSSSVDNAAVTIIPLVEPHPESVSQEIKELASIADEMKEIMPKVEKIAAKEDKNHEAKIDEAGEPELLLKASNVINMSPFDISEFDTTHEYKGDEQDEINELKLKLANCEDYTDRLLEALGDGSHVRMHLV